MFTKGQFRKKGIVAIFGNMKNPVSLNFWDSQQSPFSETKDYFWDDFEAQKVHRDNSLRKKFLMAFSQIVSFCSIFEQLLFNTFLKPAVACPSSSHPWHLGSPGASWLTSAYPWFLPKAGLTTNLGVQRSRGHHVRGWCIPVVFSFVAMDHKKKPRA